MNLRVLSLALLLTPASPALAQDSQCTTMTGAGDSLTCTCPSGFAPGSVWGSGPYTADSSICTAAQHAGAIGPEGGLVTVNRVAAPESYRGSTANGVTSSSYGSYDSAYLVAGAALDVGEVPCGPLGPQAVTTCGCPALRAQGTVWGSDPYTDDSDICTAAVHAGVIGPEGGVVTLRRVAGQESYRGSAANGVTSSDYGSWGRSFTFSTKN